MKSLQTIPPTDDLLNMAHQMICLRNILALLSDNTQPINDIFTSFVHLIPEAWQYSDITCSRLKIGQDEFTSTNFVETKWSISSDIIISDVPVGSLDVHYLDSRPILFEGPFLKQERDMIETLTEELARFIEQRQVLESKERQHRELILYSSFLRHDLKNDLGVILANVDLTRMIFKDNNEELEETIHSTEVVCSRMIDLLNSFGRSADAADHNLIQLINRVAKNAEEIHSGLNISLESHDVQDSYTIPRSNLLPLVFENLLRNSAIHAGDKCSIVIDVRKENNSVVVRISDDGPGISEDIRDRLFQKGVSTRGGGLGLYLSRQVLVTIGGSINCVSNRPGEGAVFDIILPLAMLIEGGHSHE